MKNVPVKFEDYVRSIHKNEEPKKNGKLAREEISVQTKEVLEPAFGLNESVQQSTENDLLAPIKEWERLRTVGKGQSNERSEPSSEVKESDTIEDEMEMINEAKVEDGVTYKIIRDKDETFECKISVEGTTLASARARLVIDSDIWNLTFYGSIQADGTCKVPIKRGLPLLEGSTGKIRLEVIAEDQLFVGWEDDFVVESSKKVKVERADQKKVKVSF